jgi:hypothetical protein
LHDLLPFSGTFSVRQESKTLLFAGLFGSMSANRFFPASASWFACMNRMPFRQAFSIASSVMLETMAAGFRLRMHARAKKRCRQGRVLSNMRRV